MADAPARTRISPQGSRRARELQKSAPKPRMTSRKAGMLLSIAILFDVFKFICDWLWFFGPFVIAAAARAAAGGGILGNIAGLAAGAVGATISPAIGAIGIVLAIIVSAFGWLVLLTLMAIGGIPLFGGTGKRFLTMMIALVVSETPFIDMIPTLTPFMLSVIRAERKADKAAQDAYAAEQAQRAQEAFREARGEEQLFVAANAADVAEEEQAEKEEAVEEPLTPPQRGAHAPLLGVPSL